MLRLSSAGKSTFIERNQEEFEKHLVQVLTQMEVFEKTLESDNIVRSM